MISHNEFTRTNRILELLNYCKFVNCSSSFMADISLKSTTPFLQIFSICAPNVLVTAVPGGSVRLSDLAGRSGISPFIL